MTRFTNRITLGLGALVLAVGVGTAGFAWQDQGGRPDRPGVRRGGPGGPGGPGGFLGRGLGGPLGGLMLGDLDLTDAQREQVRAIAEARRAADEPLMDRARTARQGLQAAIQAVPVNEAEIRARHAELSAVEADLAVSQAQFQAEVFTLLTPEQQAQVNERRQQMRERMEGRRDQIRERRGR